MGVAVSDPLGISAQGLSTIAGAHKAEVIKELQKICLEKEVSEVVMGLPINMDGSFGPKAKEILTIVAELETSLKLPIKTWDERLSSRQAERWMIESDLSRAKRKTHVDQMAAILILQNYLDSKRPSAGRGDL